MSTPPAVISPDPKFAFPRTYLCGIAAIVGPDREAFLAGNIMTILGLPGHGVTDLAIAVFDERVLARSSNAYTLDMCVVSMTFYDTESLEEITRPWYLTYHVGGLVPGCQHLAIEYPFAVSPKFFPVVPARSNWFGFRPECNPR